jgi:regulator of replication initiation timing
MSEYEKQVKAMGTPELLGELTKIHDDMELEAKKLIVENGTLKHQLSASAAENERLEQEIKDLKQALDHYADAEVWRRLETASTYADWYQKYRHGFEVAQQAIEDAESVK